jgi:hypothetical protein
MVPELEQRCGDQGRCLVRTRGRSSRPIEQAGGPVRRATINPLVGGLPTDPKSPRQVGEIELVALILRNELHPLIHE